MKLKHMWLALIPLCMASCSEEETIVSGESQREVRVTAGASNHSRVVLLNNEGNRVSSLWEAGDKISLFTATQSNLVYGTDIPMGVYTGTATFTPVDEALECREGNMVYACYPDVTKHSEEGMVVNLPSTEVMDYNDGSLRSFGYATSTISNGSVNFQFKHISAFIALEVKPEMLADATKGIGRITVSTSSSQPLSVGEGDTFDFSTQTISATHGSNTVQVNMDNQVIDSEWTFYIPVLPQPAGADITITLKDSDGQTHYTQTKPTPESGFVAGHTYHQKAVEVANVAYLVDGPTFNSRIRELSDFNEYQIGQIKFITDEQTLPEEYIVVSAENSPIPIYASYTSQDSLITIFSPAKNIEVVNASQMFFGYKKLKSIDFGSFHINETTTNMASMFYDCSALTTLDIGNWNVENVTNMASMFFDCSALTTLDIGNWNVGNVTNMASMFCDCSVLATLDLSNWNVGNVTDINLMFRGCSELTTLDFTSSWNVKNVTNMSGIFYGCSALTTLDLSNWNVENVTNMAFMFYDCSALTTLDISNWNVTNVTDMYGMFAYCSALTTFDLGNWDVEKVTNMGGMFSSCSMTTLDLTDWNVENVTYMDGMFAYCSALTTLDLSNWDVEKVTNMGGMFRNCTALESLNISNWNINNVSSYSEMFENCASVSQACKITTTQATKEFLLSKTSGTEMNPAWFIWGDAANGDSSLDTVPKEEW